MPESDLKIAMRRNNRIATALVFLILAAIGIVVTVAGREPSAESGGESPLTEKLEQEAAAGLEPSGTLLNRFALTEVRRYDSENLYEYINGEAERYIQFGFGELVVAQYGPATATPPDSTVSIVVDQYDMRTRRNAFGIYIDSRPMEDEPLPIGNSGSGSGDFVSFWKGPFYVRIRASAESAPPGQFEGTVREIAEEIAGSIDDPLGTLVEFSAFPVDGLQEGGLTFEKESALGLAHFHDVFVGQYDRDGISYRLFFMQANTAEEARQTVQAHIAYLRAKGNVEVLSDEPDYGEVAGGEKYLGPMLLVRRGRTIAGAIGIEDVAKARSAVTEVLAGVERVLADVSQEGQ